MVISMLTFGVEEWATRGDGFGAYFGLLARMSPLVRGEDGAVYLRRPLSGLAAMPVLSASSAFGVGHPASAR